MERLRQRLRLAEQALATLEELAYLERPTDIQRDAAIQRFEYSYEAVWKAAQRYLLVREGLQTGSPKSCIRAFRDVGLLREEQTESALEMADDRNLTVHTYNEALAQAIFARLGRHAATMKHWLTPMKERLNNS
ncbi:MAG: HI0074 family nucleotidyltransferase substrate-binding subunit [Acidobacteriota bacterium]